MTMAMVSYMVLGEITAVLGFWTRALTSANIVIAFSSKPSGLVYRELLEA